VSTTRKPDPNAGALFLAKLLAEDEADRIENLSDEESLAAQKRAGRPMPDAANTVAPVERLPPLSRGQRVALLLAAAFIVAIVLVAVKRPDVVTAHATTAPTSVPSPDPPREMTEKAAPPTPAPQQDKPAQ
jgi:hypothetical protein